MLARIRRLFQLRPKRKSVPPGEYVACVHKVSVHPESGDLHIELVVPHLEDQIFHAYLPSFQADTEEG